MHTLLVAFYAGPDQIMTVTSGLASIVGLLLIFWNKVVGTFFRFVRIFRAATPQPASATSEPAPVKNESDREARESRSEQEV
jgi:hypothetical protein